MPRDLDRVGEIVHITKRINFGFFNDWRSPKCCFCDKKLKENEIVLSIGEEGYICLRCVPDFCETIKKEYDQNKIKFIAEAV